MNVNQILRSVSAIFVIVAMTGSYTTVGAAEVDIDSSSASNGIFDIYSATFDPPLIPGGDPFFGGTPPVSRAITMLPNPTLVLANNIPCGLGNGLPPCAAPPQAGSFLDLALSNGDTTLTIAGGTIAFGPLNLNISGTTDIVASNAGMVFNATPRVTNVEAGGQGIFIFEVDINPAIIVDFSTFGEILDSCSGPLCALVLILTLDMQRYRLTIDFDPTFTSFTADFVGQTANNSMVFATLNSGTPAIVVTDSVAPAGDQQISFGNVTELTSADETVTVTNTGNSTSRTIDNISVSAPFSIPPADDNCSSTILAPAASCTLTLRFTPGSTGPFNDTFDIPSDDLLNSIVTVTVDGTGTPTPVPDITVTETAAPIDDLDIPFGVILVATTSDQTVTVTNDGAVNLVLGNVAQANALAAPFSILNDSCSGLAVLPSANCTFTVRFAPTIAGLASDVFDIPSNDPDESSVLVNVGGTGSAVPVPEITVTDSVAPVSDTLVDFANTTEGTSSDETVTVTNDGSVNLVLGNIAQANSLVAPFSIPAGNDACSGQSLASAASCIFTVRFSPAAPGAFNDSLDIPSNDPDENPVTIDVTGMGTPTPVPDITVTDSAPPDNDLQVPFGNVTEGNNSNQTVTVTNDGNADLVLGNVAQADTLAAPFSLAIITDTCSGQTLLPAANCTFVVNFAPPTLGNFNDSLDIPSNDADENPVTVSVSGTGAATPVPDITVLDSIVPEDDLQISFGDIATPRIADAIITVVNDGNEDLLMGMIAEANPLADPFSVQIDNCSAVTLAPSASCAISVRMRPTSTGHFNDSLDIPSDDTDEPSVTVSLTGRGVDDPVTNLEDIEEGVFGVSSINEGSLLALLFMIGFRMRRRHY